MIHVRRFNRFRKTQRQLAKFFWRHVSAKLEQLFSPTVLVAQRFLAFRDGVAWAGGAA
jgi:hypothetical protein